jgi:hypothetical protein
MVASHTRAQHPLATVCAFARWRHTNTPFTAWNSLPPAVVTSPSLSLSRSGLSAPGTVSLQRWSPARPWTFPGVAYLPLEQAPTSGGHLPVPEPLQEWPSGPPKFTKMTPSLFRPPKPWNCSGLPRTILWMHCLVLRNNYWSHGAIRSHRFRFTEVKLM